MRSARFWAPVVVMAVVAMVLGGCTTNYKSGPSGFTGNVGPIPSDLPPNPDPCASYCKEWVPPVYRQVPVMKQTAPGYWKTSEYTVMRTDFEDVQVKPRERKIRTGCGTTCEESLVQIRPSGYRWAKTPAGCWKYEFCEAEYKWTDRVEREEGITYGVESPPEYETIAITHPMRKTKREWIKPEYKIVYEDELYVRGHWRWVGSYDCNDCEPKSCDCRPTRVFSVEKKCKKDCVEQGCRRCN